MPAICWCLTAITTNKLITVAGCAGIILTDSYGSILNALLQPPTSGVRLLLLHGMGGLGKSTLAKVAYMAARGHFGEGNYAYCELEPDKSSSKDHLTAALRSMLSQLKLEVNVDDSLAGLRSRMVNHLAPRQRPVMLVVDDVLNGDVAKELLGEQGKLARLLPER